MSPPLIAPDGAEWPDLTQAPDVIATWEQAVGCRLSTYAEATPKVFFFIDCNPDGLEMLMSLRSADHGCINAPPLSEVRNFAQSGQFVVYPSTTRSAGHPTLHDRFIVASKRLALAVNRTDSP